MHIARLTHLTAQAIANIVDELVAENFLMQLGRLKTGRGQPLSNLLSIHRER